MDPVKVGLLGLGTVGGGTVEVLRRNAEEIARRAGRGIVITRASARDIRRQRPFDTTGINLTRDPFEVVDDPELAIVVELIGGESPARELVLRAIDNGKHVVTANKALIAKHGNEIFAAAPEKGVMVAFEAAVAGGIPIIKAIREGLAANRIQWLAGIINGTGNFILTEMRDRGASFDEVLAEAQRLGYAEADPTFDVEGIDAAHKLTILAAIAFGIPLQFDKVYTEGITRIATEDVDYAAQLGYRIKHLGIAKRTETGVEMRVHPTLIPHRRLIANVDGVMNAVLVNGDAVGPTLYYGAGAVVEGGADGITVHQHRIHYPVHVGDEAPMGNEGGMDAHLHARLGALGDAQVLDAVAQLRGVVHVLGGDAGDALGVHLVELQGDTESNGGEDGELVGGVDTLHVEGGVGLGIPQALGLGEDLVEGGATIAHLGEDEIAGTVDDAGQPLDAVGGQTLADGLDDGDAAGYRRLEGHHHPLLRGGGEDLVAVLGDEGLVGGDHVFAVVDGAQHQFAGGRFAADEFDDDGQLRVVHHFEGVAGEIDARRVERSLAPDVPGTGAGDDDTPPGSSGDLLGIAAQHLHGAAADRTQAQKSHLHRIHDPS